MPTLREDSVTNPIEVKPESTSTRTTTIGSPADWFHLYFPSRPFEARLDALLVGEAYHRARALAHGNTDCRFVVVHDDADVLDSLEELKAREDIGNMEIKRGAAKEIEALETRFDLIFFDCSVGQPRDLDRCMRAMRSVLRPEGSLHLKVPGRYGWHGIGLLRRLAATLSIHPGAEGREAAQELVAAVTEANRGSADESEAAAVAVDRRLLGRIVQPEQAAFTIDEVLAAFEGSGYRLQRLLYQAPYLPDACGLAADSQLCEDALALPPHQQWALVELFRGSMGSHEMIACRSDRERTSYDADLDGQDWLAYVPVLSPLLETEFDGLLPGTAMRIRCRGHLYSEISVLLDATQAALCRSIDGSRSAGDLVALVDAEETDESVSYVQNLLKSLWRYDYIWFQTQP
jgi:SAM-dependent methyltransferase